MEWSDEAIVLSTRPHGETSALASLLTRDHGRLAGLVRGGQSARARAVYQPGNLVRATWRGRLAEHLGGYTCEPMVSHAARLFDDPPRLTALLSAAALSDLALPEREPHPACFHGFLALLEAMEGDHWAEAYVRWELALLGELGFGLDLSACAGGGDNDQLAYVSPRSGRAVSLAAGEPYRDRLLALPSFLAGRGGGGRREVEAGLTLTGFFLERHISGPQDRPLPAPRRRLGEHFRAERR